MKEHTLLRLHFLSHLLLVFENEIIPLSEGISYPPLTFFTTDTHDLLAMDAVAGQLLDLIATDHMDVAGRTLFFSLNHSNKNFFCLCHSLFSPLRDVSVKPRKVRVPPPPANYVL